MNAYPYPQQPQQQQQPQHHLPHQQHLANPGGISPAMLAYQRQMMATPANGMSTMGMPGVDAMGGPGGINPAMLQQMQHHQQQQQSQQQQHSPQQHQSQMSGSGVNPASLLTNNRMAAGVGGMGVNLGMGNMSGAVNGFGNMNMNAMAGSPMLNGAGPSMSQQNLMSQRQPSFSGAHHPSSNPNMGGASSPPSAGNNVNLPYANQLASMTPQQLQIEQQKAMLQHQAAIAGNNPQQNPMQNFYPQQRPNSYPPQAHLPQGNMYPPSNPHSGGMMPPHLQQHPHQQSHPSVGSMMMMPPPRPNTAMSSSSHHSSTSHQPLPPQQPPSRTGGTPIPILPHSSGGQGGMPMGPPGSQQQQHPGQPPRPPTSMSSHAPGGGHPDQQQQQHPPPISRPGTAASIRQASLGPAPGTPMGMAPPQLRSQTPGFGPPTQHQHQHQQPPLTPQREMSHPPSRPQTAQSNHGGGGGGNVPPTPTSAQGLGPNPPPPFAGSPTTPVPGSAGGMESQQQQRGTSVPLPSGGAQMGGQRSSSVAPAGMGQMPGGGHPGLQSPEMSMNMSLSGGNPMPMSQPNSGMVSKYPPQLPPGSAGSMHPMSGMAGGMMPPPQMPRQGSLGPPGASPHIVQGMGGDQHAQSPSSGFPMMNGAEGMMQQQQHLRQQSPQRPMSQASLNGIGPMGMGGMNIPQGLQTPQQKPMGFPGQQQPGVTTGMGSGMMQGGPQPPPFAMSPSTPHHPQHPQAHLAQTPPRPSPGPGGSISMGRGSVPPMQQGPSTPVGALGSAGSMSMSAPPMTPVRSGGSEMSLGSSQQQQTPGMMPQTPVLSAGAATASSVAAGSIGSGGVVGGIPPSSSASSLASGGGPSAAPLLPPLPSNARIHQAITRVTAVPLAQSTTLIPPLSDEDIANVKVWMEADLAYEKMYTSMRERTALEVRRSLHGGSRARWWEQDPVADAATMAIKLRRPKEAFKFEHPVSVMREGGSGSVKRRGKRREGLKVPGRLKDDEECRSEQLVPIRLEFDVEHHKYRDTFVWNLNDPIVTPEIFAQSVIDDYGLSSSYHSVITKSIQEQLSDFKAHSALLADVDHHNQPTPIVVLDEEDSEVRLVKGRLDDGEDEWWSVWRAKLRNKDGFVRTGGLLKSSSKGSSYLSRGKKRRRMIVDAGSDVPMEVEMFELDEDKMHEEMRILIKLDITVGSMKLDDQFEWDIRNSDPTPEQFSDVYCDDLQLGGEFRTSIAHMIREQVQAYQKSLFLVGHPSDGSAVQDDDLRMSFLQPFSSSTRTADISQTMQPIINYLSDGELDRIDKERERELNRRRKRATRGRRGVTLPDREPIKTQRTPAIGFPEVDASTLAQAAAASAPTARRAAAAAASLTIANMVASENGTAVITPSAPLAPQAPSVPLSKIPKARGSFKAPEYPQRILRKRAEVSALPATTAADVSTFEPPLEGDAPLPPSSVAPPSMSAPDSRSSKVLTQKRQRELDKEAKEREYVDGQRPNIIDGVWHCSNCGCPESIAVGRRKGPLGDKSQCGACGKYWHRHRRPRPVQYNPEEEYHVNLKMESERQKASAKKKGGAAALRALALQDHAPTTPASTTTTLPDVESPFTTVPKHEMWVEMRSPRKTLMMKQSPSTDAIDLDRGISPASSVSSSASEKPLAQAVLQVNGTSHNKPGSSSASNTPKMNVDTPLPSEPPHPAPPPASTTGSSLVSATPYPRPPWLNNAIDDLKTRYPDDLFEIVMKVVNGVEKGWRIKCTDCPGKLYTPGPGESLTNYEVHIKNRSHRMKVMARVNEGKGS